MSTCDVKWCACLPVKGSKFCAAHKLDPSLKPTELEADEELVVPGARCSGCKADGRCKACNGEGEKECECIECGDIHHSECRKCSGTGDCPVCEGKGVQEVRKKPEAA